VQDIMKWLPKSEDRLHKMAPPAADIRPVRIQLEELKVRSSLIFDTRFFALLCTFCTFSFCTLCTIS